MEQERKTDDIELATFYIGDALCGMDILKIQEINKNMEITRVPNSPEYVLGVLNMRGRIVTIIDVGKKLGIKSTALSEKNRNIIVYSQNEYIGLRVDQVAEVAPAKWSEVLPPPSNVSGIQGRFFEGVYKAKQGLIAILDIEEVIKVEDDENA